MGSDATRRDSTQLSCAVHCGPSGAVVGRAEAMRRRGEDHWMCTEGTTKDDAHDTDE
jgi:hypothetical protein